MVALAPECGRSAVRPTVDHVSDMADQGGVKDFIDRLAIVATALVHAPDPVDRRDTEGFGCVLRSGHGPAAVGGFCAHNGNSVDCGPHLGRNKVQTEEPVSTIKTIPVMPRPVRKA